MMPLALAVPTTMQIAARLGGVTTAAFSGLAAAGTAGAVLGAIAALGMLWLGIAGANRKNRRDYADEMAAEKAAGVAEQAQWTQLERERADKAEREAEYWRGEAMSRDRQPRPRGGRD